MENEELVGAVIDHHERFGSKKAERASILITHPEIMSGAIMRQAFMRVFEGTDVEIQTSEEEVPREKGVTQAVAVIGNWCGDRGVKGVDGIASELPRHTARIHAGEISTKSWKKRGPESSRTDIGQTLDSSSGWDVCPERAIALKHNDRVKKLLENKQELEEIPLYLPAETFLDYDLDNLSSSEDMREGMEDVGEIVALFNKRLLAHHHVIRAEIQEYLSSMDFEHLRNIILMGIKIRQAILEGTEIPN